MGTMKNLAPAFLLLAVYAFVRIFEVVPALKNLPRMNRPQRPQSVSFLLGFFETFFVFLSANATKSAFDTYTHPAPNNNFKSLRMQPSILTDHDEASTMTLIAVISLIVWVMGFF